MCLFNLFVFSLIQTVYHGNGILGHIPVVIGVKRLVKGFFRGFPFLQISGGHGLHPVGIPRPGIHVDAFIENRDGLFIPSGLV